MKILVVIANYGTKNLHYLERLIQEYRSMPFDVNLVILSNVSKDLGRDVEVIVGLPSQNPWSLPFGYKKIMAERANDYDLFIYSEDDTLVTEQNIVAFMKITKVLPKDEIAGFIRFEVDDMQRRYYTTLHAHFHWEPCSVKTYGEYTVAFFSNEHAACFLMTREQLLEALQSKGFLKGPREGRYDMLCTASTDPYTQCGFKKVICISHIDDFSLHHLPNIYWKKVGSSREILDIQICRLVSIEGNKHNCKSLFEPKTKLVDSILDKVYYDSPRTEIIDILPAHLETVLSVGCGWGATEEKLIQRGSKVTCIPMDFVIAACAESRGIETTTPDFEEALFELKNRQFECLLFTNVLEYLAMPTEILDKFLMLLKSGGIVCVTVHNVDTISVLKMILSRRKMHRDMKNIGNYNLSGLRRVRKSEILRSFKYHSITKSTMKTMPIERFLLFSKATLGVFDRWLSPQLYYIGYKA